MSNLHSFHQIETQSEWEAAYTGPHLSAGPLPALFYFSLSSHDSLFTDPYNQPVAYLSSLPIRIFSLSLPGHEKKKPPTQALCEWAEEIGNGHNPIEACVQNISALVEEVKKQGGLLPNRVAVAGLSRGAFIALHAAAAIAEFETVLGFAPLTDLSHAKEFQEIADHPLVKSLNTAHLVDRLTDKNVRLYIGNLDVRVGTRRCFDFTEKLALAAFEKRVRSPNVELIISPSIGQYGHGTSKEIFHQGAQWVAEKLKAIDVV